MSTMGSIRWMVDGGHVEPVHVLQPVDLVVLFEQAFQTSVSYIVYINSVIITKENSFSLQETFS